jgi:hypothetical protein
MYGEVSHRGYAYAYQSRRRTTLDLLSSVLSPGTRILDVGGGARELLADDALMFFTNPLTHGHLKTEPLLRLLRPGAIDAIERMSRRLPTSLRQACLVQMGARFKKGRA